MLTARLMCPIAPFFGDWLYRRLNEVMGFDAADSVHLTDYPQRDPDAVDLPLERRMTLARTVVGLALLLRNRHRINVRQPLSRVLVVVNADVPRSQIEAVKAVILDEINVDAIEYIDDSAEVVKRSVKPDFKKLGPRLGKRMGKTAAWLKGLDDAAVARFATEGVARTEIDGETIEVGVDEVEFVSEEVGDWVVAQEDAVTVALDTQIDPVLKRRGLAREIVNRVQSLRKRCDLNLTDRIRVGFDAAPELGAAVDAHLDWIMTEVLAVAFAPSAPVTGACAETFDIDGLTFTVALEVAAPEAP